MSHINRFKLRSISQIICLSFLGLALLLSGCQGPRKPETHKPTPAAAAPQPTPTPRPSGKVAVGLLLPMTGDQAQMGQNLMQAAEMGLFEHGGDNIELLIEDTGATSESAGKAAQSLVSQGASLIIGPVFAPQTTAAAAQARPRNIPLLSLSNDRSVAGNGIFTLGHNPIDQVNRLLESVYHAQLRTVGVLLPDNAYGQILRSAFVEAQSTLPGLNIRLLPPYKPNAQDFLTQAQAIQRTHLDALILPEGGQRLQTLVSSLLYNDADLSKLRLLGLASWDTPALLRNTNLAGGWFVALPLERHKAFEGRYKQQFGEMPHRLASLVYDGVALAANLARRHQGNPFVLERLTHSQGFMGSDGLFRLMRDGTVQRGYGIYEVQIDGVKMISPAPQRF